MQKTPRAMIAITALLASGFAAYAQPADPGLEFGFMPNTMTVTLLNEGGKNVVIDLKHIPQGGTCRVDKDDLIARVGPGAQAGTTRVRSAGIETSTGGCPFSTTFDLSDADYAAARAVFVKMEDNAWKKIDEVKKSLGDKWNELTGTKK